MTPAAVLQIYVSASTGKAIGELTALDGKLMKTAATADVVRSRVATAAKVGGAALVGGLAYGFVKAVKSGQDFEKQMSAVSAVSGANRKEMRKLENQAIRLGAKTAFSASEAANAQEELVKGGLSVKDVLGGSMKAALDLAAAGELSLGDAAETTVNSMKLFGLSGKDTVQIADMLAMAANKTTADVSDFSMALKQGGSVAKQAGYDMNDTVTVLEALADIGVKNSDAGTSMKAAFTQLLGPTKKQAEAAARLNLDFVDQNGRLKDAAGLAEELRDGLKGMSDAQRVATLKTLAGTDGFRTLAALYDTGATKLEKYTNANREQGTAAEVAHRRLNNLAGDEEAFSGSLETLSINIYEKVKPALRTLTQEATRTVNKISKVWGREGLSSEERIQKTVDILGEVAGKGLSKVIGIVSDYAPSILKVGAQLGVNLARGLVKGFTEADLLGRVLTAAALIRVIGGPGALMATGRKLGLTLGAGIGEGVGASAGGTAGGAAAGGFGGALAKAAGFARGVGKAGLWGLAITAGIEATDKLVNNSADNVIARLEQIDHQGKGLLGTIDRNIFNKIVGKDEGSISSQGDAAHDLLKILDQINGVGRKRASQLAAEGARLAENLNLTEQERDAIQKALNSGTKATAQNSFLSNLDILKSGLVTRMQDIKALFRKGLTEINVGWEHGTKGWQSSTARNMTGVIDAIRAGMKSGAIPETKQNLDYLANLIRQRKLVTGSDVGGIVKGFSDTWARVHDITPKMIGQIKRDLSRMPKAAQEEAIDTMLQMARALRHKGQLPKDAVRDLQSALVTRFSLTRKQSVTAIGRLTDKAGGLFGSLTNTVSSALENMGVNVDGILKSLGVSKGLSFSIKSFKGVAAAASTALDFFSGKQRGGPINLGKPSGDSVPAMLERGEYVLNRNAVKVAGKDNLDRLNFGMAKRFQQGGAADGSSLTRPILTGPDPLRSGGQSAIDQSYRAARKFIENHMGGYGTGKGANFQGFLVADWIVPILKWAQSHGWSGQITSGYRPPDQVISNAQGIVAPQGKSNHNSLKYPGGAIDVGDPGARAAGQALASVLAGYPGNPKLVWGGPVINDWGHFSATGHQLGGLVQFLASGGSVVKDVGSYLLNKGFDFRATAGILGNAYRESRWNTASVGTGGGGLWGFTTSPVSLADLKSYAESRGKPWTDAVLQTVFMLNHGGMSLRSALNAKNTIPETTKLFMDEWERPGVPALSDRIKGGFNASDILRDAGIVKAGDSGEGLSDGEKERIQNRREMAARRDNREKWVRDMLRKAGGTKSALGKKGVLWQVVDMYAKYGDFDFKQGSYDPTTGGVIPGLNEAAAMLGKAGTVASLTNPNRGAGQLYSLVRWLQDRVELTGAEDGNDRLAKKLEKVRKSGGARAEKKRERVYKRMGKLAGTGPLVKHLNLNETEIERVQDLISMAESVHSSETSELGSELSQSEISDEIAKNTRLWRLLQNRKVMLENYIPFAQGRAKDLENQWRQYLKNPKLRWKAPGVKKAWKAAEGAIGPWKENLKELIGPSGQWGSLGMLELHLKELGATKPGGGTDTGSSFSIQDLLSVVEAAKYGVYDHLPKFHSGGDVGGTGHQEIMAILQRREGVFTEPQMGAVATALTSPAPAAVGDVKLIVNGDIVSDDPDPVEVVIGSQRFRAQVDRQISESDRRRDSRAKAGVR